MKVAKKFLPALLVGIVILTVVSPLATAQEEQVPPTGAPPTAVPPAAAPEVAPEAAPSAAMTTGDPISALNSWYYPYGEEMVDGWYYGWYARAGATFYGVDGDTGRFREGRFIDNRWSGGLEQLYYGQKNWAVSVSAVPDGYYAASGHYIKPDAFRVDFDFSRHREFFDGSMEPLNPTIYAGANGLAPENDEDLSTDWTNINFQGQLLVPELPHAIVGWHHWSREGDEILLYHGRAFPTVVTVPPSPTIDSIPTVNDLDGDSDTIYVEIPVTIKDKYNFNFRQEYENYDEDQDQLAPSNRVGQTRLRDYDPKWREFRTLFTFDSFITPNAYVTANYYHDDVKNRYAQNTFHPGAIQPIEFADTDVDNRLITDVFTCGAVLTNLAKDITIHGNFKVEGSDTDTKMTGLTVPFGGTTPEPVLNATETDETRLGEYLAVVSNNIPLTTIKLEGEWEQRFMELDETIEGEFAREADIDYDWQAYTLTAATRPLNNLKLTGQYRFRDRDEDYDEEFLAEPGAYPGFLGDLQQDIHLVTLKADWHFLPAWTTTAKYEFQSNETQFDAQSTEGQDLKAHRVSGTIYGNPFARLLVTAMGSYERYKLDTPTDIPPGSNWAVGEGTYDSRFEAYILFLSGSYAINDKWLPSLSYQHTEYSGEDVDSGLDEVWVGVDYMLAKDKTIYVRYEYFNYDDELFGGFDDYSGHGIYISLAYQF